MASETLMEHFAKVRTNLISLSDHLGIAKHGDIKGTGREALINQFLKANLPSQVDFYTGEIIDKNNFTSGQIDIIVQSFSSPKIHLINDLKIALADNVIAIIEVKSVINTGHLKHALDSFKKVKLLNRSHNLKGNNTHDNHPNTPCILFGFHGPTKESLISKIIEYSEKNDIPFDSFAPNVIIVLDRDYAICRNDGWLFSKNGEVPFLTAPTNKSCITSLFIYLSKMIEVWNSYPKFSKFENYF